MELEMTPEPAVYLLSLRAAVFVTLVFVLLSIPLARWVRDFVAFAILPQLILLGASWFALVELARNLSGTGSFRSAAAAWCAEAQAPLMLGAMTAVLLSVVLFILRTPTARPALATSITFSGLAVLLAGEAVFAWYLSGPGRTSSPGLVALGSAGVVLSLALGASAAFLAFRRRPNAALASPRAIAVLIFLLAIGFGFAIHTFAGHLRAEAAGL